MRRRASLSVAEQRIDQAVRDGMLDDLPGRGRPLHLENLDGVPPELRASYLLLRSHGFVPPELEARREWLRLRDEIFRYEQACVALVGETRHRSLAEMNGRVRVVEFTHDPGALLPPLQAAVVPPPGLPPAPHRVEIELVDGVLETRWTPLGRARSGA